MFSKILCLLFLAMTLNVPAALAQDRIRISIKNDYSVALNFGVLGKGSREGIDTADGVLEFQAGEYTGIVTAWVSSTQTMAGLGGIGSCGPGNTETHRHCRSLDTSGGFNPRCRGSRSIPPRILSICCWSLSPCPGRSFNRQSQSRSGSGN